MHDLISDITQYLKENNTIKSTIYSSCQEKFPLIGAIKRSVKQKSVISKKPLPKIETINPKKSLQPTPPAKPKKTTKHPVQSDAPENPEKSPILSIQKEKSNRTAPSVDLKSFYNKYAPNLHVYQTPKDDIVAKRVKKRSSDQNVLSDIVIFTDARMANYTQLLSNMAHAIDVKFQPCRLLDITPIEKEGRWENIFSAHKLHLIILPDLVLFQSPKLILHYKELNENKTLSGVPCFILDNLEEVQKNPSIKKSLWEEITSAIGK